MKAGRELDALISIKVFGTNKPFIDTQGLHRYVSKEDENRWEFVPDYSTDIAASFEIVRKMLSLGFQANVFCYENGCRAAFWKKDCDPFTAREEKEVALAICLAALKAVQS